MQYKVVYVCYITRRGFQKQYAYISKATKNIRLASFDGNFDKELHAPLITVEFFKTKDAALKDARKYCYPEFIFEQ